ncbi:N-acetylmuramoyl-L-alanine amidase [Roseospira navarrensis]|nr:N-acetylmuramoyl-L-alanine amidase [Roseospira navarrensis]
MKKLAIVVGHTGARPGAFAVDPIAQSENAWNADLAGRMKAFADSHLTDSLSVEIFTRDDGGVSGAYRRVREWGADAAIELHFNAATPAATGTETLYHTAASRGLAEVVQAATLETLGLRDRGVKTPHEASGGRGTANLSQMGVRPSILTEPFFGSNPGDCAIAQSRKQHLAEAQVGAAARYLSALYDDDPDAVMVIPEALNVRGGPGTDFGTLSWGPLTAGTVLTVLDRGRVWWKVCLPETPSRIGFVHSDYVA